MGKKVFALLNNPIFAGIALFLIPFELFIYLIKKATRLHVRAA